MLLAIRYMSQGRNARELSFHFRNFSSVMSGLLTIWTLFFIITSFFVRL